jgi:preprotein translocase subunit SecE
MRDRAAKTAAALATPGGSGGGGGVEAAKKKTGFIETLRGIPRFFREVRAEGRKITWTSRRETWVTSVMVAIMVVLAAIFFWIVDFILRFGVTQLLKLADAGN